MYMVDNRGYILIGVLLSFALLSIIVAPLSLSLTFSAQQSASAANRLTALELAQGKLEEMTSYRYEDIGPMNRESFPSPFGFFDFAVQVVVDCPINGLKKISVTVYYPDSGQAGEKNVSVTGARARR